MTLPRPLVPLLAAALALATPARSQQLCAAPEPASMPACMVGAWFGESDMAAKMQAILDSVPEHMRARMGGDMGRYHFLQIAPDGFFVASPLAGEIDGRFLTEGGPTDLHMEMMTSPGAGWMWVGESGAMGFCALPGAGAAALRGTATNEGGTTGFGTLTAAPGGFTPETTALCDGDLLLVTVGLPDPIGTVTYELRRLPSADLPPEMRALVDDYRGR